MNFFQKAYCTFFQSSLTSFMTITPIKSSFFLSVTGVFEKVTHFLERFTIEFIV